MSIYRVPPVAVPTTPPCPHAFLARVDAPLAHLVVMVACFALMTLFAR